MAAITSNAVTGNWSSGSSWVGGVPPTPGIDTATIVTGATITVDVDTTIGTSPADQTTMVLTINGPTGKLKIPDGVTLTVQGNVYANAGASGNIQNGIEWQGTGQLQWPVHNVGSGSAAGWVLKCGQYNRYYARGTSFVAQCGISTAAGSTTNACLTGGVNLNTFDANCMTFQRLGSSSIRAMISEASNATTSGSTSNSFTNCIFDSCGEIDFGATSAANTASVLTFTGNVVRNSLKNGITAFTYAGAVSLTTPAVITNNIFADAASGVTMSPFGNAICTGNYFGGGCQHGTSAAGDSPDKASGTFSNNMFVGVSNGGNFYTSLDHCYLLQNTETQNSGIMAWKAFGDNRTMDSCVVEVTYSQGTNTVGDMIQPFAYGTKATVTGTASGTGGNVRLTLNAATAYSAGDTIHIGYVGGTTEANGVWAISAVDTPGAATWIEIPVAYANAWTSGGNVCRFNTTLTIQNTISLPGGPARAGSKWVSVIDQSFTNPIAVAINHCTWAASNYGTKSENGIGVGENNDIHTSGYGWAGEVTSLKSNIAWSPDATYPGYLMVRQQSTMKDYAQAANVDYNWGYQLDTDAGTSPVYGYYRWSDYQTTPFFSTGSPDANGCVANATYRGDPQFVDSTRCMPLYDSASSGLNNGTATGWATSTGYSVGDMVSQSKAGYYGGATINYRCIAAHTSGSTTNPGTGASWRTAWEFASLYRIREAIKADATGKPLDLLTWVQAGFAPTNADTATAAHDGTTVGAVAYQSPGNRRRRVICAGAA